MLSGTPAANGLIGTVTVSTVGAFFGVYDLKITNMVTANGVGPTTYFPGYTAQQVSLTNGRIYVYIPEPSSIVLGLFATAGFGVVAIRKRRVQLTDSEGAASNRFAGVR